MISERRLRANRANALRSTGPKTAAGKARSALNAVRHGLLAKHVLVAKENPESFQTLFKMILARFSPVDDVEFGIVEEMTAAYWRLRRAWTIETELLDSAYANQPAGQYPTRIAGAFSDLADTPTLTALHRDETRLHVMFQRCLQNLVVLRHLKPGKDDTPIALPQFLLDKIKPTDPPEMRNEPNNSLPANKIIDVKPSANPNPNPPAPPAEPTKPNAVSEAGDLQRRECPDFRTDPQAGVP